MAFNKKEIHSSPTCPLISYSLGTSSFLFLKRTKKDPATFEAFFHSNFNNYEYDKSKISFTEPKEGFVVKRGEWEGFIHERLTSQLGLTERETDDLVADVKNALINLKESPYLKVSFVDREELEDKLPVEIFPVPDTFYRLHLLLLSLNEYQQIPEPTTTPFVRDGFTVIELGAVAGD